MESRPLLTVNDQPISLEQVLGYFQASGKLKLFIGEILRQYVIEQELRAKKNLGINPALIEQEIINFRLEHHLTDSKKFEEWLVRNGTNYGVFHSQMAFNLLLNKLRTEITEPKLHEYFIERKIFLDRVVLSRIMVAQQELAEELRSQIEEGAAFEDLAREYSLTDERMLNGMMGPISRGSMPDKLRAAVDSASLGDLLGPLELEEGWGLFRVEQILPASLEEPQIKQALQNELFERWLSEKIQKLSVKLQVSA